MKVNEALYPWLVPVLHKLQQRYTEQQLHHGLLFVADQGVGENELINQLTKTLVCSEQNACGKCKGCMLYDAQSHPDIKRLVSDKPSIGVDLIRSASEFVTTTSQLLGNKVVVIENIERMTESASNSLLKTLEEPSQNTYLLLSTNKPNRILATITSRCEKIRLSLPNVQESLAWLASKTQENVSEEGLMAFSGSAIDYLQSLQGSTTNYLEFDQDLALLGESKISGLALAEKWQGDASLVLSWIYQKTTVQYKTLLNASTQTTVLEINQRLSTIESLVGDCQQANKKIGQAGINKSLILQQVFNKFQAIRENFIKSE